MRKRERENPCGVCGHYHKYEEGEVCGICGHRMPAVSEKGSSIQVSAFPSEILPEFLFLGSYDNASRAELLKTLGISRILNCAMAEESHRVEEEVREGEVVEAKFSEKDKAKGRGKSKTKDPTLPPITDDRATEAEPSSGIDMSEERILGVEAFLGQHGDKRDWYGCWHSECACTYDERIKTVPACQNLYKNSFTYHCLQDDQNLAFDDAVQFLEQCEKDRARVLVHCMLGKNRSAAIVIAYLMKSKGWNLAQSLQWAKERRPSVDLTQEVYQQLQQYERKIFGSLENQLSPIMPSFSSPVASFNFGFPKPSDPIPAPAFINSSAPSLFSRPVFEVPPQGFTFGASHNQHTASQSPLNANQNPNDGDIAMDGS
ncbi:protein-tyrosine-phosphatase [Datura stramonium]|uniref:Protein-tyrosine-phosphatase n=1 Tax=Datura stramonium TaxID=4076 RepID=A0ABS8V0E0_DATST|nr:protein-tyrosine-phosphatase [Datura stramonium]